MLKNKILCMILVFTLIFLTSIPLIEGHLINKKMPDNKNSNISFYEDITFIKTYNNLGFDEANSVLQTYDGGYLVTGYSRKSYEKDKEIWMVKTDEYGEKEWENIYQNPSKISYKDISYEVLETSDQGYMIIGSSGSYDDAEEADCWIIKIDNAGDVLWDKTYGNKHWDQGTSIIKTRDGNYVFTGRFSQPDPDDITGVRYAPLIKIDPYGTIIWHKKFKSSELIDGGVHNGEMHSVIQTEDGGYFLTGTAYMNNDKKDDIWVIKADSFGNHEWHRFIDSEGGIDVGFSGVQTNDGSYIIAGKTTESPDQITFRPWIIKVDNQGSILWDNVLFRSEGQSFAKDIIKSSDGSFVVVGGKMPNSYSMKTFIVKIDNYGYIEWQSSLGYSIYSSGNDVKQTNDGGFIIAGFSGDIVSENSDFLLIKTDQNGNTPRKRDQSLDNDFIDRLFNFLQSSLLFKMLQNKMMK